MKILLIIIPLFFLALDRDRARQAIQEYENSNYEAAEQGFREALEGNSEDPRLWYNLGNALAQQGRMDEAQEAWQRFQNLEPDETQRAQADYNLGNLFSSQEEYDKALQAYRDALRKYPDDEDARHNYELARRLLQEQEQDQQQQQDQGESMEQDGQQQQGEQQPDQQDQQQQQQSQSGDDDQQDQQQGQPQPQEGELSLEDADNMLNALDNIEKDLLRDFQQRQMDPSERNEKDW